MTALLKYLDLTALLEYIDLLNRYSGGPSWGPFRLGPLSGWGPFQAGARGKMPQFPPPPLWAALCIGEDPGDASGHGKAATTVA